MIPRQEHHLAAPLLALLGALLDRRGRALQIFDGALHLLLRLLVGGEPLRGDGDIAVALRQRAVELTGGLERILEVVAELGVGERAVEIWLDGLDRAP